MPGIARGLRSRHAVGIDKGDARIFRHALQALRVAGPGTCSGAKAQKPGWFELQLQWQGDGRLKIETWVEFKGGDMPDPGSARASWRDSQIRLACASLQPEKSTKCLDVMKLDFQLDQLPRKDYQVAWDSWTSGAVALIFYGTLAVLLARLVVRAAWRARRMAHSGFVLPERAAP